MIRTKQVWISSVAVCCLLLGACTKRKTGTVEMIITVESMSGMTDTELQGAMIKRVLETDPDAELKDIEVIKQGEQLHLKLSNFPNDAKALEKLRSYILSCESGLQFYEVFENNEMFGLLDKLNKQLLSKDSIAETMTDPKPSKKTETFEEKLAEREGMQILNDSNKPKGFFRNLLQLNVIPNERGQLMLGQTPQFGYCKISDTAELFPLLREGYEKNIFSKTMLLRVGKMDVKSSGILQLYMLKLTPPLNKPAMEGEMFNDVHVEKDEYTSQPVILMNFNGYYANKWRELTKRCAPHGMGPGKPLAIVYNDQVLSAPTVNGEIPNGSAQITGGFSKEEAETLCQQLRSGYMPAHLLLQQFDFTANP